MNKLNEYWCHSCKNQFQDFFEEDEEPKCKTCQGIFIEMVSEDEGEGDHPKNFEPYVVDSNDNNEQSSHSHLPRDANAVSFSFTPGRGAQAIHIISSNISRDSGAPGGMIGNLISMLNNMIDGGGQDIYEGGLTFDQILQQIIANDPNKYGPPPASKDAVEKLPKGTFAKFFPKDEEGKENDK